MVDPRLQRARSEIGDTCIVCRQGEPENLADFDGVFAWFHDRCAREFHCQFEPPTAIIRVEEEPVEEREPEICEFCGEETEPEGAPIRAWRLDTEEYEYSDVGTQFWFTSEPHKDTIQPMSCGCMRVIDANGWSVEVLPLAGREGLDSPHD